MTSLPPQATIMLLVTTGVLLLLLIASFVSRPRVFTQYLHHLSGIKLSPHEVAAVFKTRGQAGVRDLFIELIVREDLRGGPRLTPDSAPDHTLLAPPEKGARP